MGALPDWELRKFTADEYLALERDADLRSEYLDGYIYAMAGASPEHERIVASLAGSLVPLLRGTACATYGSNLMIRGRTDQFLAYPDLTVVCGGVQFDGRRRTVVTNPTTVFEILSPGTESRDRGAKLDRYREIETLREYVMISQVEPRIMLYRRTSDGDWDHDTVTGLDAEIRLPAIDVVLRLLDIYDGLEFSGGARSGPENP